MSETATTDGDASAASAAGEPRAIERVSNLELFFDLVFVLTITQLTALVAHHPNGEGVLRAAVLLAVIFYMYGGYAWLTNSVAADRATRRLALLGGMGAFLVIALAIPTAFDDGHGYAFGIAYLVVNAIHISLFARGSEDTVRALISIIPVNVTGALLVLAGSIVGGDVGVALMASSIVVSWGASIVGAGRGFDIGAEHFVERHGLVIIVAIGESVVAIGTGTEGLSLTPALLVTALLGLALSAALWWLYFGGDDELAAEALAAAPTHDRGHLALRAFGYWHVVMLFGIILLSAGIKKLLGHPFDHASTPAAIFLATGVALFLVGESLFRNTLKIGRGTPRAAAAALALIAIPVGTQLSGVAALALLVALLASLFAVEAKAARLSAAIR